MPDALTERDERSAALAADAEESELLSRIAATDNAALEELYARYYGRLFRFVSRTLRRTDVADEIINDVMYVVWQRADSFNGTSRPSTWIFGIAYNKTRRYFGDARGVDSLESLPAEAEPADNRWQERMELGDLLEKMFRYLSTEQRLVLELTYFHGMHYREISEVMACPENTVKTRMFHARRRLAGLIERERSRH